MARAHTLAVATVGLLSSLATVSVASAMPLAADHKEIFMPANTLNLQDCRSCEAQTGITEAEFNQIIDRANEVFAPIVESHGGSLNIARLWDDSTVNASAAQIFLLWQVNMYGGMARRPEINTDGFTMVLCHEIGHHLGGFPFVSLALADEGEADYFAAHACPALIWGNDTAANAARRDLIPASAKARCDDVWQTEDQQNLCYRTANGAKSVSSILGALRGQTVSFETRDTSTVDSTFDGHPDAQCRLDTYMAGATCTQGWDKSVIPGAGGFFPDNGRGGEAESAKYVCTASNNFSVGLRPACWFKATL